MPRIAAPLASLVALAGAWAYASSIDVAAEDVVALSMGRQSIGVLLGALGGVAIGLLAHGLVRYALKVDTQAAFQALVVGFGAKAMGAVLPWAVFTYLPQATALADGKHYLMAYVVAVLLVVGAGVLDNLHLSNEIALDAMESHGSRAAQGGFASGAPSASPSGSSDTLESMS